ncbi:hypothetical protein [Pseudomonas lundensis]|uniref:hypothetical protein n=1 Tax=Pseudomonas lundensis TaxID=86185 RepID=UPI0011127661|nr:hypothetical protein [Pseudomonas lundensis]
MKKPKSLLGLGKITLGCYHYGFKKSEKPTMANEKEVGAKTFYFAPYAPEIARMSPKAQNDFMYNFNRSTSNEKATVANKILKGALIPGNTDEVLEEKIDSALDTNLGRKIDHLVDESIPYGQAGRCTYGIVICLERLPAGMGIGAGWVEVPAEKISQYDQDIICVSKH